MSTNSRWPWAWPSDLEKSGVLGINRRNLAFIQESNPRALYPRLDDKTVTKEICHKHNIPRSYIYRWRNQLSGKITQEYQDAPWGSQTAVLTSYGLSRTHLKRWERKAQQNMKEAA